MQTLKKILDFLTPVEKKQAFLLLILILCMALLDVIGIASVLPFIAVLSNPELIETSAALNYLYQASSILGVGSNKQFMLALGVVVFLLLIISLILRSFTAYAQVRYALMREYSIGARLIKGYLHEHYGWFLNRNSADLHKVILSGVSEIIHETIIPGINLVVHSIVTLTILTLLFVVNYKLALAVSLIFAISYGSIFFFMKNILFKMGSDRLQANEDRFIAVNEAFGAIKEVKVGRLEKVFVDRFSKPARIYASRQSIAVAISAVPRYFIEGIAFGGMILLILVLMMRGDMFSNILPIIVLYTFAGYRLIPSLQQIYVAFTQLRFSSATLDSMHKDLKNFSSLEVTSNTITNMQLSKSITLANISFDYPDSKKSSLKNINLFIPAFKKVGIIGATGSGKTTLIDIILGLLDPKQGTLSVDGNIINFKNKQSWQKSIGYVPQQNYLVDNSIAANIAFGIDLKNINHKSVEQAAKIANLHDFIMNELPNNYNTIVGERGVRLSGGQRQRIAIARALYRKPQVLILDEATSALDGLTEQTVMEAMHNLKNKITTILITHRLSAVKNCDIIFVLEQGELKDQGSYEELNQSSAIFKKMLETQ
ncbi:ABC transporter ATP-binding protein/permease [Candidatus Pelagibacter ubique]|nr:ABC transporter ATP-binding protein/permease [Candidatus Pelagibacter ubique]